MNNELFAALSARTGGSCAISVRGARAESLVRSLAAALSLPLAEEELRAEGEADAGECRLRILLFSGEGACDAALIAAADAACGEEAEALRRTGVPFAAVLLCGDPASGESTALCGALRETCAAPACAVRDGADTDAETVLSCLLSAFPLVRADIELPAWMCALPEDSGTIASILEAVRAAAPKLSCMADCAALEGAFPEGEVYCEGVEADPATGIVRCRLAAREGAFHRVLSAECGEDLSDDVRLMAYVRSLREAKAFRDAFSSAFARAKAEGYGIVQPSEGEMEFRPPELIRRGGRCGVRLSADAPSYHIVRVDVHSEVTPVTGDAARSEEIAKGIVEGYERDAEALWNTDMFGKTFREMLREGLSEKTVPEEARGKLRRALTRIVNEGRGGVICILL